jgi:purine-nucleoside phosphorylase
VNDPYESASVASARVSERTGVAHHDVAVVLGSGWRPAADALGDAETAIPTADLPGFPTPTVGGHDGELRSLRIGGKAVLVAVGRVHGYEGHLPGSVVHGIRTLVLTGCRTVVITNAAGGLSPELAVGEPVLISDHLNLTGSSPLTGPVPDPTAWSRFPDMSDAYSARLRTIARTLDSDLTEGVYAGVSGPQYETPAEIRMLQRLGADLVGMSTVHETIAAVHMGAEVLGISLVANLAAGLGPPVDHTGVLAVTSASAERMGQLIARVIAEL